MRVVNKPLNILVACEESQAVTKELRRLGHNAFSCDILECSGGHPEWHIKADVIPILNGNCEFRTMDGMCHFVSGCWDIIFAFPPCTDLATSGARHFEKKRNDGRQRRSIEFFCKFLNAKCPIIVIENPMGIMSGGNYLKKWYPDLAEKYNVPRPYNQIVQPWWFAESEDDAANYHDKTTCFWQIGTEPLVIPDRTFDAPERYVTSTNKSFPAWYSKTSLRGSGDRQVIRSRTFPGIAKALAEQVAGKVVGLTDEGANNE